MFIKEDILKKKVIYGINDGIYLIPLFDLVNNEINKDPAFADKINNLRYKILRNKSLFREDVENVFGKGHATNRILKLNNKYKKSGLLRKCGNPYFIHQLDMAITALVLNFGDDVINTDIDHDTLENFSIKVSNYGVELRIEEELGTIPLHIRENVNILTNKHRIIAKYLEKKSHYDNQSTSDVDHMFLYLDDLEKKIKDEKFLKTINHTRKLLGELKRKKKKIILFLT